MVGSWPVPELAIRPTLAAFGVGLGLAGCGGGQHPGVNRDTARGPGCQVSVRSALAALPGLAAPVRSQLVSGDSESAICAYRAGRERLTVELQAIPQAYRAY